MNHYQLCRSYSLLTRDDNCCVLFPSWANPACCQDIPMDLVRHRQYIRFCGRQSGDNVMDHFIDLALAQWGSTVWPSSSRSSRTRRMFLFPPQPVAPTSQPEQLPIWHSMTAMLLLGRGEWAQHFLGHSSIKTTMDEYGTISIDEMQEVAERKLA